MFVSSDRAGARELCWVFVRSDRGPGVLAGCQGGTKRFSPSLPLRRKVKRSRSARSVKARDTVPKSGQPL